MKTRMKILSFVSIVLNAILSITLTVFVIQIVKSGFGSSKFAFWISVFLFMFIFSIGLISLIIYKHTKIKGLLINGILAVIPFPYLSVALIIYQIWFIIKIDEYINQDNRMKFNFQEKN